MEVASFSHHFQLLADGEPGADLTVRVCDGLACRQQGALPLLAALQADLQVAGKALRIEPAPCVGRCEQAPAVQLGQVPVAQATPAKVQQAADALAAHTAVQGGTEPMGASCPDDLARQCAPIAQALDLAAYRAQGGYATYEALLQDGVAQGQTGSERALAALDRSSLRGLGGAGFAAARKWRIVRGFAGPRLMVVNIDEGEPGTFKDRWVLERDPHRMLEGVLIAAAVVGCEAVYLYLRDEYHHLRRVLQTAIQDLRASGLPTPTLHLRRGAGAYICGEESALIESVEGKRGEPRLRPPYIAESGLFGRPTLAHNAETVFWLRELIETGGERFAAVQRNGRSGLRSYSVSGRVRQPGVKLAPAGITVRELINEHCGGMADGHTLAAYFPGGASGGILPASLDDVPLDFDTLQPHGCFIGSAAVMVLSQHDDIVDAARQTMAFFAAESCGQCTPCRVGTAKALALMQAPRWDHATLQDLCTVMADASICGLGQAAPNPLLSLQRHFPQLWSAA
jgi:formate dehydrogenase